MVRLAVSNYVLVAVVGPSAGSRELQGALCQSILRTTSRTAMRKPVKTMAERASNVHEEALKHGYLRDHALGEYVYVGPEPEPRSGPPSHTR